MSGNGYTPIEYSERPGENALWAVNHLLVLEDITAVGRGDGHRDKSGTARGRRLCCYSFQDDAHLPR